MKTYTVSRETIEEVLKVLAANWFSKNTIAGYNNEDIIAADIRLRAEIGQQERK